jgi:MYXO-CTERM domain-containing protein
MVVIESKERIGSAASGRRTLARCMAMIGVLAAAACVVETEDDQGLDIEPRDAELPLTAPPRVAKVVAPLDGAHCQIQVDGQGLLDMEEDYLPHVIQCENGGANLEALKAQAIAARSVAYYNIETSGSICDSQGCQVYGCGATPSAIHYQAVEETSGVYLMYNDTLTYGFYVAGDNSTAPPACVGVSGSTEGWVTYNEGASGTNVEQTALGFIHDPGDFGYGQNRGCMSQWGARCLENDNGYDYLGILRFYYGDDIVTVQGEGACVLPLPGEETTTGEPPGTTGGGGESTGTPSDSTGAGGSEGPEPDPETGEEPPLPGDSAGESEGSGAATDGPADDVDPALPTTFGADDDAGGCGCRSTTPHDRAAWWLLGMLGFAARRRARRAS